MKRKNFRQMLEALGVYNVEEELSVKLHRVMDAMRVTNKQGKITLSLTLKPAGSGQIDVVSIVTVTVPEPTTPPVRVFVNYDNEISTIHPDQERFENAISPDDNNVIQMKGRDGKKA